MLASCLTTLDTFQVGGAKAIPSWPILVSYSGNVYCLLQQHWSCLSCIVSDVYVLNCVPFPWLQARSSSMAQRLAPVLGVLCLKCQDD